MDWRWGTGRGVLSIVRLSGLWSTSRSPPGPGPADVQKASMISDQPHRSPSTGSRGHRSVQGPSV